MLKYKILFIAVLAATLLVAMPLAHSDDLNDGGSRNLAYLSVQAEFAPHSDASPALEQVPSQAPDLGRSSIFSDSQANLMRTLANAIDVIPGGVRLCLNIHY